MSHGTFAPSALSLSRSATRGFALAAVAAVALVGCGTDTSDAEPSLDSTSVEVSTETSVDVVTPSEDATEEEAGGQEQREQTLALMAENLHSPESAACLDELWPEDLLNLTADHLAVTDASVMGPVQLSEAEQPIDGTQGYRCSFTTGVSEEAEPRSGSTTVYTADEGTVPEGDWPAVDQDAEVLRDDEVTQYVISGTGEDGNEFAVVHTYAWSEDASSLVYQTLSFRPDGGGVDDAPFDLDEVAQLTRSLAQDTSTEGELRDTWRDLEIATVGQ